MSNEDILHSLDKLTGFEVQAEDGEKGKVTDVYFDDQSWAIRYFVIEIGSWLAGERVLIAPDVVGEPDFDAGVLPVHLTREQVENAPDLDVEQPVSRQKLMSLHDFYGWETWWPGYWAASPNLMVGGLSPAGTPGVALPLVEGEEEPEEPTGEEGSPHLRSADEVTGYHIRATDGDIGHVEDFFAQTSGWVIRYLLVDTRNLLPGKKVLLAPEWIDEIDWDDREVGVELTREQVKSSPEYDPDEPLTRKYESALYEYYGRPGYWETPR